MSVDIRLNKVDRVYRPGDVVSGVVIVNSKGAMSHGGVNLRVEGEVTMQLSAKSVGLFEAFYQSIKPIRLVDYKIDVKKPGKLPSGVSELPFEFRLVPLPEQTFYETYHGVFVNIQYTIEVEIIRKVFAKNLNRKLEFILEVASKEEAKEQEIDFTITPQTLENVKKQSIHKIPQFEVTGKITSGVNHINRPFTGELTVVSSDAVIRSIELQLVRVETCGCADGFAKEARLLVSLCSLHYPSPHAAFLVVASCASSPTATEIQNVQIAEVAARTFKIEFEVNLVIMWQDGHLISENFPIRIVRVPAS